MELLVAALSLATAATDAAGSVYASSSCCGAHPELCKPLSPQPGPQQEVIAFHAPGMYGANAESWQTYDFDKLTGVGMFTPADAELMCRAHAKKVRILDWFTCNGPNGDPKYHHGIQLNPHNQPWMLLNATEIAMYVDYSTKCVKKYGFDGMVLDVESLPWPCPPGGCNATNANATVSEVRSGLTDLVCALKHSLREAIPGSVLTFTTAGNPIAFSNSMDYAAMSECLDFFMPMVYDSCQNTEQPNPKSLACSYEAAGSALSTVAGLKRVAADYLTFGVHPSQLAPALNWFSNDFACIDPAETKDWNCSKVNCHTWTNAFGCTTAGPGSPNFHGIPNPGYGHIKMIQSDAPGTGASAASKPVFDAGSGHYYFNYGGAIPPATTKSHRQVWIEGPKSTKLKYDYLIGNKFRGFGIWTAGAVEAVDAYWWGGGCNGDTKLPVCPSNASLTAQFAAEMWGSVPARAPSAPPAQCARALVAACPVGGGGGSASGVMQCDECIGRHQAAVRAAGCSAAEVQEWCRHRQKLKASAPQD